MKNIRRTNDLTGKRNGFISVNDLFNNVGQYRGNQQTADTVERSE